MSELSFRFAQPEDCGKILEFVHALAEYEKMRDQVVADEATLREWIFEKGKAEVLFAVCDGKEVGFALFCYNFSTFLGRAGIWLEDLFVLPEYRRLGVGSRAARMLTESFGGWWQLMMHPKNEPSHGFWQRTFEYEGAEKLKLRRGPRWYDGGLRGTVMTFYSKGNRK